MPLARTGSLSVAGAAAPHHATQKYKRGIDEHIIGTCENKIALSPSEPLSPRRRQADLRRRLSIVHSPKQGGSVIRDHGSTAVSRCAGRREQAAPATSRGVQMASTPSVAAGRCSYSPAAVATTASAARCESSRQGPRQLPDNGDGGVGRGRCCCRAQV